ncbi:MAG: hypothetical protein ACJ8AJ_01690 [Gemmatimonadaceae bacterium]
MKLQTIFIAGTALVLPATACDPASSITGPKVADAKPSFAAVSETEQVQDVPWGLTEINPCNGAPVTSDGTVHTVTAVTFDNSGGVHLSNQYDFRGSGVGPPPLLLAYTVNDQFTSSLQIPEDNFSWLEEQRVLVKAPKPELNYIRHMVFKWTFANGATTVMFDRFFTKCAGGDGTTFEVGI